MPPSDHCKNLEIISSPLDFFCYDIFTGRNLSGFGAIVAYLPIGHPVHNIILLYEFLY